MQSCRGCQFLVKDFQHCTTEPQKPFGECVCKKLKGYICAVFPERLHSGWDRNSVGCELFQPIDQDYKLEWVKKNPGIAAGASPRQPNPRG